jgi:hypothetical protein
MTRLLLIASLVVAATAPARADGGFYGVGARVEYGTAYLPPTAGASTTTMIRYREIGGFLGNLLVLTASAPIKPEPSSRIETETSCSGSGSNKSCTTATYEVTTYPSSKEIEDYEKKVAAWDPAVANAIMRGEAGQEVDLDIALRTLGGDTSGFIFRLGAPFLHWGPVSMKFALGWLTFHDVHTRIANATSTEIATMEKVSDFTYKYVGLPIRVQAPIGLTGLGVHLQVDLNIPSIVLDEPSPIRAGVQWFGYHLMITVETVVSGFRADGVSLASEVALAF